MAKIVLRFNTKHVGDSDAWRVFEDDREHHVSEFFIEVPSHSNTCLDDHGKMKWNVCCEGILTIKDGKAYVSWPTNPYSV